MDAVAVRDRVLSGNGAELGLPKEDDSKGVVAKAGHLRMINGCRNVTRGCFCIMAAAVAAKCIVAFWVFAQLPWSVGD